MSVEKVLQLMLSLCVAGVLMLGCTPMLMGGPDDLIDIPVHEEQDSKPPIYEEVYGRPIITDVYTP